MTHDTRHQIGARTTWTFAAGFMPDGSTGHEPEYTSRDELTLLNTTDDDATVDVSVYHADKEPVGPYRCHVPARRVNAVRVNDLIDPQAVPLGVPYAMVLVSDVPIVAQLTHLDTRQAALGVAITSGLPGPA